jgi:hypothetical protein
VSARVGCLVVICVLVTSGGVPAEAATIPAGTASSRNPVELWLSRTQVSTRLGESFRFSSTVRNDGGKTISGLVAHLNVVSLSKGVYVDPEDWSSQRTRYLAPLRPGQSAELPWKVTAVNGGRFAIYVVIVPSEGPATAGGDLAVSPALGARVTERRTLNSGGVLPLSLGVPALLGLATLVARARRRR